MAHAGVAGNLIQFIGAAANLSDVELAVALQGILSRRPAVREAFLSVVQAECIVDERSNRSSTSAVRVNTSQSSRPMDPVMRLRIGSQKLASFHGAGIVGSEHVLAAAAHMLQDSSRSVLGDCLHTCLLELLERSSLQPPAPGQSQRLHDSDDLPFQPDAEHVFTAMAKSPHDSNLAVFTALLGLPDNTSASQLLELARVFTQSRSAHIETAQGEKIGTASQVRSSSANGNEAQLDMEESAIGTSNLEEAFEGAGTVMALAQRFAKHNQAKVAGTDHVLAAALQAFPEESEKIFGKALRNQLLELLEKSALEPPGPDDCAEGVGLEPETTKFFEDWAQRGPTPDNMIQLLLSMPDADSATQLIEMAKVFVERSS